MRFVATLISATIIASVASNADAFVGQRVGWNNAGAEVKVTKELGTTSGYDDRYQATAVVRMAKADPAVVVKGRDGRWHALQVSTSFFEDKTRAADNSDLREVVAVPLASGMNEAKAKNETTHYV